MFKLSIMKQDNKCHTKATTRLPTSNNTLSRDAPVAYGHQEAVHQDIYMLYTVSIDALLSQLFRISSISEICVIRYVIVVIVV